MQLELTPTLPFDFGHTLRFLRDFRADGGLREVGERALTLPLLVSGEVALLRLESLGTVVAPALRATVLAGEVSLEALEQRVTRFLGLEIDLAPFYDRAQRDAAFAPVLERLYGFHPVSFPSLFSCVCWALVTQRTPNGFAYQTMARLRETFGAGVTDTAGRRWAVFPEPAALLAPEARSGILAATNNTRKTERLSALARAFLSADEEWLRLAPYDEAAAWLGRLPGIGPWSSEYVLLRGLGRFERTPWTDTWLLGAISGVYTGGLSISRGDARALAEGYGAFQGVWALYLKRYGSLGAS